MEVGHPLIDLFNPVSTRQQVGALALYFLALKGSRGLQCTTFIHNLYQLNQVLGSCFSYCRFETLFSTLSGVDEKIEVYSHVTLMIKCICIQRHPDYVFKPKNSLTLRYSTNLKSALEE